MWRAGRCFRWPSAWRARGIPIVFSTGYGAGGLPPEWRGNAVIAKPFDAADLGKALLQTLAGK
ncbi:MAG: hypothetical protein WDM79_18490 [Terricaulis sp.]